MKLLLEKAGRELFLDGAPLFHGGEGRIFALGNSFVAKIFDTLSAERAEKLARMIGLLPHFPTFAREENQQFAIAWPLDRLLTKDAERRCVGYVMRRFTKCQPLFEVYNRKSGGRRRRKRFLFRVAQNLASAVHAIHNCWCVVGDLNESNILVDGAGRVHIVDADSFQLNAGSEVFRCRVGRPEYTPPELQGVRFDQVNRRRDHDSFGLAVLIFQILMDGNHPYAARYCGKGEREPLEARIAKNLWPYAEQKNQLYLPKRNAPLFEGLYPRIQELMRGAFEPQRGGRRPRPTALSWEEALDEARRSWRGPLFAPRLLALHLRTKCIGAIERAWEQNRKAVGKWIIVGMGLAFLVVLLIAFWGGVFPSSLPVLGKEKVEEVEGKATPQPLADFQRGK